MTGQDFDLVQSATMQVQGVGQTVGKQPNCFSFSHIIKPVGGGHDGRVNIFKESHCHPVPNPLTLLI